jgi:hypothetical protein
MPTSRSLRSDHGHGRWPLAVTLACPIGLWTVIFLALPPARQEFPLNDDWSYARGAFAFARTEGINYFGWASMPLLGQWLWALPFMAALGESHVALRLSTIAFSLLGVAALYDLLRQAGWSPMRAAFGGATLALNPLFFLNSGTFMSDIPSLSLSLIALALYGRALGRGRADYAVAAALVALVGAVTRQNTLAAPLAASLLVLLSPRLRRPLWLITTLLPLAVGGAVDAWFASRPDVVRLAPTVPTGERLLLFFFAAVHSLGLWAAPLLLLTGRGPNQKAFLAALAALLGVFVYYLAQARVFPYLGNMITPWGQFEVNTVIVGARPLLMGFDLRTLISLAGCVAGALLATRLAGAVRSRPTDPLLLFSAVHVVLLLVAPNLFDRYLLVLLPGALLIAGTAADTGPKYQTLRRSAAVSMLALSGLLSLALMHDWLAWNAARWELGRRALARGIPPEDIEGGFEWNGWHAPVPARASSELVPPRNLALSHNRTLWPHLTGRFALSFSEVEGTHVWDTEPYHRWLLPGQRRFYLIGLPPARGRSPAAKRVHRKLTAQDSQSGRAPSPPRGA